MQGRKNLRWNLVVVDHHVRPRTFGQCVPHQIDGLRVSSLAALDRRGLLWIRKALFSRVLDHIFIRSEHKLCIRKYNAAYIAFAAPLRAQALSLSYLRVYESRWNFSTSESIWHWISTNNNCCLTSNTGRFRWAVRQCNTSGASQQRRGTENHPCETEGLVGVQQG